MNMGTITNLPLKDQIATILRREIAAGNMADGEELTQEEVATALAVSRIPVREAFLQLESEGLLRRLPNRHVQVVGMTPERLRQNLICLAAMEEALAELLAQKWMVQSAMDVFSKSHCTMDVDADSDFHLALSVGLDNPTLRQLHIMSRRSLFGNTASTIDSKVLYSLNKGIADALDTQDAVALRQSIHTYYEAFLK